MPSPKIIVAALAPCAAVSVICFLQHRTINGLRQVNYHQAEKLSELTSANESLSNRLARLPTVAPSAPIDPPRELLRSRGEVSMLRREIQEVRLKSSSPHTREQINDVRIHGKEVCAGLQALLRQLEENPSATEAVLQTLLQTSGLQDPILISLVQQREKSEAALDGAQDGAVRKQIEDRVRGILLGLQARVETMIHIIREMGTEDGQSLVGAERFLADTEKALGGQP